MNLIKRITDKLRRKPLLVKPAVSNQRELLLAFLQYLDEYNKNVWFTHEGIVKDFLSKQ